MNINGKEYAIQPYADLYGADLYGANLGGANLREADLNGAETGLVNAVATTLARTAGTLEACES